MARVTGQRAICRRSAGARSHRFTRANVTTRHHNTVQQRCSDLPQRARTLRRRTVLRMLFVIPHNEIGEQAMNNVIVL